MQTVNKFLDFLNPPHPKVKIWYLNLCANLNKAYVEVVPPHFPVSVFMQFPSYKKA
jgi:hypothetical protein